MIQYKAEKVGNGGKERRLKRTAEIMKKKDYFADLLFLFASAERENKCNLLSIL